MCTCACTCRVYTCTCTCKHVYTYVGSCYASECVLYVLKYRDHYTSNIIVAVLQLLHVHVHVHVHVQCMYMYRYNVCTLCVWFPSGLISTLVLQHEYCAPCDVAEVASYSPATVGALRCIYTVNILMWFALPSLMTVCTACTCI